MKSLIKYLFIVSLLVTSCRQVGGDVTKYVNPFIGTGGHGHTYPGATLPFGGVQLSPDTRVENWDACSGYHYSDSTIMGFSHTHLSGTGCVDLGDILMRPTTQNIHIKTNPLYTPTLFNHKEEYATPGYYKVNLPKEKILAELTTTTHCGISKYTYFQSDSAKLIIDLKFSLGNNKIYSSSIKISSPTEIEGGRISGGWVDNRPIYFACQFNKPILKSQIISEGKLVNSDKVLNSKDLQVILYFNNKDNKTLEVKTGLSLVSKENAKINLVAETKNKDFEQLKNAAHKIWQDKLGCFQIKSSNKDALTNFYTALYHTMVVPNIVSDINNQYRINQTKVGVIPNGTKEYSTLSIWDIYRAWSPLMTLIEKPLINNLVTSLLNLYDNTGELPIWPLAYGETNTMIGYHSVSIIADAYMKGFKGFNAEKALEAMIKSSNINKKGSIYYIKNGFIPANKKAESVSCTLEYSYDDWCIARMAEAMGKTEIAKEYYKRSLNYINVFDGNHKFFRGKKDDGNWVTPFNTYKVSRNFTEANAWQYRFACIQDINGLIQEFGTKTSFISALDSIFTTNSTKLDSDIQDVTGLIGQYAQGNEPSHHTAFLYNYVGEGYKTQARIREILKEMFHPTPEGICGNEDCGQMSAWYILASIGLYQTCPGSNQYLLTSPIFKQINIKLLNGKELKITSNSPDKNKYIKQVKLNGKIINTPYITYNQIINGGRLDFELSSEPNKNWAKDSLPLSQTTTQRVAMPYINKDVYLFQNSTQVEIKCNTPDADIRYTLNGEEPTNNSPLYTQPIKLDKNTTIKAKGFKKGMKDSQTFNIQAIKAIPLKSTSLTNPKQGIKVKYFEGAVHSCKELTKLPVKSSFITDYPDINKANTEDHFGFIFEGYIYAPKSGKYNFITCSDDGSLLYIDNQMIVDNDGSHAFVPASGSIVLDKGFHKFSLIYFEDYEGQGLTISWQIPGEEKVSEIPKNMLFYK